jgi:hypothetical protein
MKQKYLVIIAGVALGLGGTVFSVENQSGTSAPKLIRLKSNGDTVAELRIPKGTMFEVAAKESNYDVSSERQTAKGDVTIRITYAGGSTVIVKTDEIEAVTDGLPISGESTKQEALKSSTRANVRFVEHSPPTTEPRTTTEPWTFPLKSRGKTIAEVTITNLKGEMEITSNTAIVDSTDNTRPIRLRGDVQIDLKGENYIQGGDPIRITAEEIEFNVRAPKK